MSGWLRGHLMLFSKVLWRISLMKQLVSGLRTVVIGGCAYIVKT